MGAQTRPSRAGIVPWPEELRERYVAKGYWEGLSLGARIQAVADRAPDATAFVDGELRLSYRELMSRADGAALRLRALGLSADDRIIVQLPNRWEFAVLTLACLRLGVIPVMALPAHRRVELAHLAGQSDARAIAVPEASKDFDHQAMAHELVADASANAGALAHVLVAPAPSQPSRLSPGSIDLRSLCQPADSPAEARRELDAVAPDGGAVAVFLLSGGTTGLPKLIARTHDDYAYCAKQAARVCDFGADTVFLAVMALGHSFTLAGPGLLGTLMVGGRVVIAPSAAPQDAFATIERERVTVTAVVPTIAQRWLDHREADRSHDLSSLCQIQVGGARLADEVAARVTPTLGCALQQGYGMAEGLICYTRPGDPDEVVRHTQGRPISPDDELLAVDEEGRPVPEGEPGSLLTRGPYTHRGYYLAEEENARAFVGDGWFRTGDVVRIRPDGNVIVEGRDKDMINRGGEKISAEEVENFAYRVEGVALAAAVAMPDPDLGERVCLYVVPQPGRTVGLADVVAVMERAQVARFKLPERLVLAQSLPTTKLGKIDKKALRADIQDRLAAERVGAGVAAAAPTPPPRPVTPAARLTELADYVVPFTLRAVSDLRIADHLAGGPLPVEDLALLTGTHAPSLYRALRALACKGVFTEVGPGVFDLTPLAEPLRSDHPESLRDAYPFLAADIHAWAAFDHSLRTGESAFEYTHGTGYWQYMAQHPQDSARFDASQQSVTRRELRVMLPGYDWGAFRTIADVGGGNGAFLSGILAAFPSVHGILFDQPHVVAAAGPVLAARGVTERCDVVGGSFLDADTMPRGADAYLLKRILYAWNDEQATDLLRAIRAAMRDDSRLLLLEPVLEPGDGFDWGKLYDVLLLAMAGGGARSREQLEKLFAKADLELVRVVPTRMLPIVEFRPV